MPTQRRNGEMSSLGRPDTQFRADPAINYAEINSVFKGLPGLVGYWPGNLKGSSSSSGSELSDDGPRELHLTQNGSPVLTANSDKLAVWQHYDGSTDYYSHADAAAFDITGALTILAWANFDTAAASNESVASKWVSSNLSYNLFRTSTGNGRFAISTDGTNTVTVDTLNTLDELTWYFLVGRYTSNTQLKIWDGSISNLRTAENTTSIPASIFNGTADFAIGGQSGGANLFNGGIGPVALLNLALPDVFVDVVFQRTRATFGAI